MKKLYKLRIGNIIKINLIKYKIIDIQVKKSLGCLDFFTNSNYEYELKLLNESNCEISNIILDKKNIQNYLISFN